MKHTRFLQQFLILRIQSASRLVRLANRGIKYENEKKQYHHHCLHRTCNRSRRIRNYIKEKFKVKVVLGTSNVSFGLPARDLLNATFMAMCAGAGLSSCIANPSAPRLHEACDAVAVLQGVLSGKGPQAMLDMVALNLGCALHLLEDGLTLRQGVDKAKDAIAQGAAAAFFKDVFHA